MEQLPPAGEIIFNTERKDFICECHRKLRVYKAGSIQSFMNLIKILQAEQKNNLLCGETYNFSNQIMTVKLNDL
jgi:hypothetical protein